ncbi:MAG: riboflavin synthase [Bacteroidetes bacterium]|jgi:riboflavin synthase|nr:riboflavin synthase [Bacteroidota bacterium]
MFTGIIEGMGRLEHIAHEGTNVHFTLSAPFVDELHIDQSVAHDGVCLTVVGLESGQYTVTAIDETLQRTNLQSWVVGSQVNLERCTRVGDRLDGHIVQGHVDTTAILESVMDLKGSWKLAFRHQRSPEFMTVPKGSITINGISLTVVDSSVEGFSVAIIPYTWEHTNLGALLPGNTVNIEFDIVGKYVARMWSQAQSGSDEA